MYKILRICPSLGHVPNYREILSDELFGKSYYEQIEIYKEEEVIIPGSWAESLEKIGKYKVWDILPDDFEIQKTWVSSHRKDLAANYYRLLVTDNTFEILIAQIDYYKPDMIFLYAGGWMQLTPELRKQIYKYTKHKNFFFTGMWADELPKVFTYETWFDYSGDYIFVSTNGYKKKIQKFIPNKKIYVTGNSLSNFKKEFSYNKNKKYDVVFVGTTGYGVPEHSNRYKILNFLCSNTNIKIFTNEIESFVSAQTSQILKIKIFLIYLFSVLPEFLIRIFKKNTNHKKINNFLEKVLRYKRTSENVRSFFIPLIHENAKFFDDKKPLHKLYPDKVKKIQVFGKKYNEIISQSKIVINIHRDEHEDYGNIRDFEVTGIGSMLMADKKELMSEYFVDGKEYVSFDNENDLLEKINYYLSNQELITKITLAGMKKTQENYMTQSRAKIIDKAIQENL